MTTQQSPQPTPALNDALTPIFKQHGDERALASIEDCILNNISVTQHDVRLLYMELRAAARAYTALVPLLEAARQWATAKVELDRLSERAATHGLTEEQHAVKEAHRAALFAADDAMHAAALAAQRS